ncbi:hypothetical protein I352_04603 [Cryptococcus deuterogattii MMRL2647]|nr:hypothetical protein I352_04603 [Cryptococcus deuterogattii MMRL2647]
MPHFNRKQQALREIDNRISRLYPFVSNHLFRRQIQYLLSLRRKYESERHYEQLLHSTHYENHDYLFQKRSLLPSTDDKMVKTLRMNYADFRSLVALFGDHAIFKSEGRKPQAPPEVHLATCFYRMAGGEKESTVENHFNLSQRAVLARKLYAQYGLPSCVGFIDGTDIVLHQTSSIGREKALKLIAVVDHLKRFRYCWFNFSAPVSDQMAQDLSDLRRNSD